MNHNSWRPVRGDARVRPLKHVQIIDYTERIRNLLSLRHPIDVEEVLNKLSDQGAIEYEIVPDEVLGGDYAITNEGEITIQESIMDSISDMENSSCCRHRFTIAHELGHALLHRDVNYGFARAIPPTKPYESAECQANAFAGFLLVSPEAVRHCQGDIDDVSDYCYVSNKCAEISINNYKKRGLI